jgi:hypothetical protein
MHIFGAATQKSQSPIMTATDDLPLSAATFFINDHIQMFTTPRLGFYHLPDHP